MRRRNSATRRLPFLPERVRRIRAQEGDVAGEKAQFLYRAAERRGLWMPLYVAIEPGGLKVFVYV